MSDSQYMTLRLIAVEALLSAEYPNNGSRFVEGADEWALQRATQILDTIWSEIDPARTAHAMELNRQNQALRAQLLEAGIEPKTIN